MRSRARISTAGKVNFSDFPVARRAVIVMNSAVCSRPANQDSSATAPGLVRDRAPFPLASFDLQGRIQYPSKDASGAGIKRARATERL
jgi:hypothetical protein